jgi:hypothetical protein
MIAPRIERFLSSMKSRERNARLSANIPLRVHARYTRDEVLTAIGRIQFGDSFSSREGVLWHPQTNTDYFFVTLNKSEKYYSPSTRYRDYAISPELFHWESQSGTPEKSPTGQRYIHHMKRGSSVMLFVRSANKDAYGRTPAFTFLGPATYQSHSGERPMAIVWKLHRAMPLDVVRPSASCGWIALATPRDSVRGGQCSGSWSSRKQPIDGQVLVDVWPVNSKTRTRKLPPSTLLRGRPDEPGKPRERHADRAAVHQVDHETIVDASNVPNARSRLRLRSSHSSPSAILSHSREPIAPRRSIPSWRIQTQLQGEPGITRTSRMIADGPREHVAARLRRGW